MDNVVPVARTDDDHELLDHHDRHREHNHQFVINGLLASRDRDSGRNAQPARGRRHMTQRTVHLAGDAVSLNGRIVQRCLICGYKLADNLNCAMPIPKDGSPPIFPTWGVGAWVETEGNRSSVIGQTANPEISAADIPAGCCLDLVE